MVVDAWPKLPDAIKAGILAMVMAGRRGGLTDDRNGLEAGRSGIDADERQAADRPEIDPLPPGLGSHPAWIFAPNGRRRFSGKIGKEALAMNESKIALTERLRREGRWAEASKLKDTALAEFRAKGMKRDEASEAAWDAMEKAYPPLAAAEAAAVNVRVQGLGEIPASWPELPANASLSAEIGWVQANRLRIVEERPGAAPVVRLDRAMAPAPSWAALSWLETSIRSYAKYVEVAAKATSTAQDEQELVRNERMDIEEIRSLLAEMMPGAG